MKKSKFQAWLIVILAAVLSYLIIYKLADRMGKNDVLQVCSELARTVEEGQECQNNYRESISR